MKRILYIGVFSLIFLGLALFLQFHLTEGLPIALLGGCLGWAFAEFRKENITMKKNKSL